MGLRSRWKTGIGWGASAGSVGLLVFMAISYLFRFDRCAAITVFPAWMWLVPGVPLALVQSRAAGRRAGRAVLFLWLAFAFWFADTPASLVRGIRQPAMNGPARADRASGAIRVVSLNAAGSRRAAAEVAGYRPDIVLLQESPSEKHVRALAQSLFGADAGVVPGPDTSILVRGRAAAVITPGSKWSDCALARVRLVTGDEITVVCLRLSPVPLRLDLWSPDCWEAYTVNRKVQRRQMDRIWSDVDSIASSGPVILGGDFNAPPGDPVFRPLRKRLSDAFRAAGVGWGNTVLNDWPVARIDQVWVSEDFRVEAALACRTRHSDHRMVVCDLVVRRFDTSQTSGENSP